MGKCGSCKFKGYCDTTSELYGVPKYNGGCQYYKEKEEQSMNAMFEKRKDEDFVRDNITPKTNADRIRAMSDEELAEFLKKFDLCTNCKYGEDVRCTFGNPCTHGFATAMAYEWLKSEVKE